MVIDDTLDRIIKREGGFVDRPEDAGGPTNYGITISTLSGWRDKAVTAVEVRALDADEARQIYRLEYIERPGLLAIENAVLFDAVLDSAVNHGPATAIKMLQKALGGLRLDGVLGPVTRAALAAMPVEALYRRFVAERARRYGEIITADPKQATFAKGWMNRLAGFIERKP